MEKHLLKPFLPENAQILLLGSFPPKREKWKMEFYYPNFQNDMWRIFGLIFFNDKEYFLTLDNKSFNKEKICDFLIHQRIAVGDSALVVNRLNDNASDKFLEVLEVLDFDNILSQIPLCKALITTGEKSAELIQNYFQIQKLPKIGEGVKFNFKGRELSLYRVPSSSRAYPKSIEDKAIIYQQVLQSLIK